MIARHFPDAAALYAARGWSLPHSIDRVYDAGHAAERFGFRCRIDFAAVLGALRDGAALPFTHDPAYAAPATAMH